MDDFGPAWPPDDRRIVFQRDNYGVGDHLFVVDVATRHTMRLTWTLRELVRAVQRAFDTQPRRRELRPLGQMVTANDDAPSRPKP
jgi:hypothetical protein